MTAREKRANAAVLAVLLAFCLLGLWIMAHPDWQISTWPEDRPPTMESQR